MDDAIISRKHAIEQGLASYYTGEPCINGHVARRNTKNGTCFVCSAERAKQWYIANPERAKVSHKEWKAANPDKVRESSKREYAKPGHKEKRQNYYQDNKEYFQSKMHDYYLSNQERRLEYSREWKRQNPSYDREYYQATADRRREVAREWRKNNPERVLENNRVRSAQRRARRVSDGEHHTVADRAAVLVAQGHRCANCNADLRKVKKHLDHIVPLSRGGSNSKSNIQYLCEPCNLTKAAKDPIAFAREQGRLL